MSRTARLYTEAEYLEREDAATEKSEYVNGRIYAMSGVSPTHDLIVFNLIREFANQIRGRGCRAFTSDTRVKAGPTRAYFYPDLSARCGPSEHTRDKGVPMLINPTTIVEVLSPSTAAFDRGEKFEHYRRIPSMHEYVVVAQDRMYVECRTRAGAVWMLAEYSRPDDLVDLPSVGCVLRLRDLYADVVLPTNGAPTAPRLVREETPSAYAASA